MTQSKPSRREALHILAQAGVLALGGASLLSACKAEEKKPAEKPAAEKPAAEKPAAKGGGCEDLAGLSDADKSTRTAMKYVGKSAKAEQNCANCALYLPPKDGGACGACSVVKGPINPAGWCSVWAKKAG